MKKAQKTRLLRVGSLAMAAALLTACGSGTSSSSSAAASESASEAERNRRCGWPCMEERHQPC